MFTDRFFVKVRQNFLTTKTVGVVHICSVLMIFLTVLTASLGRCIVLSDRFGISLMARIDFWFSNNITGCLQERSFFHLNNSDVFELKIA